MALLKPVTDIAAINTSIATKATKVSGAVSGHLASLTAGGDLADSGIASNTVVTNASLTSTLATYVTTSSLTTSLAGYLPLTGGTLTGGLIIRTSGVADNLKLDSTGSGVAGLSLATDNTVKGYWAVARTAGQYLSNSGVGDMIFRSESNNILFGQGSGASTLNVVGSNVGIGTASPSARLHVETAANQEVFHGMNTAAWTQYALERASNAHQVAFKLVPNGTATDGNPTWYMAIPPSESHFAIQTWDGTSLTSRLHITSDGIVVAASFQGDVSGCTGFPSQIQDLNSVLTTGNDAGAQSITNLAAIDFVSSGTGNITNVLNITGVPLNNLTIGVSAGIVVIASELQLAGNSIYNVQNIGCETVAASKRITSGLVDAGTISSGSYAADCTAANEVRMTISNSTTINVPTGTPVDGQGLVYRIKQDSTGFWPITFDLTYFRWVGGVAPTLAANADKAVYFASEYHAADGMWDLFPPAGEV